MEKHITFTAFPVLNWVIFLPAVVNGKCWNLVGGSDANIFEAPGWALDRVLWHCRMSVWVQISFHLQYIWTALCGYLQGVLTLLPGANTQEMVKVIIKKSCFEALCSFISEGAWQIPAVLSGSNQQQQRAQPSSDRMALRSKKIWGKRKIQRVASLYFVTKRIWERLDASLNCSFRKFFKPAKYPRTQLVSY